MTDQEILEMVLRLGQKKLEWEQIKTEMTHEHEGGVLDTARAKTRIVDTRKLHIYTDLQDLQKEFTEAAAIYARASYEVPSGR
jgi:hypothetical protein